MVASTNGHSSHPPLPEPGTTFEYKVLLEWGPTVEERRMNRIVDIRDFVTVKLAEIGVVDTEEPCEPNVARITIERVAKAEIGCPGCNEREHERLIWIADDRVRCLGCNTVFDPATGQAIAEEGGNS